MDTVYKRIAPWWAAAIFIALWGLPGIYRPLVTTLLFVLGGVGYGLHRQRAPGSDATAPSSEPLDDSAQTTFDIGSAALPHLRQGLNRETAQHIADIIQTTVGVEAVAITDTNTVLGWAGKPCPGHEPGSPLSMTTRQVMRDRVTRVLHTDVLQGSYEDCQLGVVVITPLVSHDQPVGSVKLYVAEESLLPQRTSRFAEGMAQLLSILLEVAEVDRQRSLASAARLEALQAQIRPHFLFNVLNTIISFSRTDPDKARELLIQLASFFRRSLSHRGPTILLKDEIDYVETYLRLEKARFGDKLRYRIRIQPQALNIPVPILMIQPLVENAVLHGIADKEDPGMVSVTVRYRETDILIYISDNGIGIPKSKQYEIFEMGFGEGTGVGLSNVAERLVGIYGNKYHLRLRSQVGRGTTIRLVIPIAILH